ncbi:hypothetical protein A3727_26420 [Erythrobacter sp. HI0038]|nr:hypothetical protein A3727_26420 [Erythrobacter sp. HI0038]
MTGDDMRYIVLQMLLLEIGKLCNQGVAVDAAELRQRRFSTKCTFPNCFRPCKFEFKDSRVSIAFASCHAIGKRARAGGVCLRTSINEGGPLWIPFYSP